MAKLELKTVRHCQPDTVWARGFGCCESADRRGVLPRNATWAHLEFQEIPNKFPFSEIPWWEFHPSGMAEL
eukprot:scaffold176436_cov32-Prasinocladus_malaysianus.AAC.2